MPVQSEVSSGSMMAQGGIVKWVLFALLAMNSSCCYKPTSQAYKVLYGHLENLPSDPSLTWSSESFLIIYVNARHLDYTDNHSFLRTIVRHPSDGSTSRDVGHVWIYFQGVINGEKIYVYGGHSGERGQSQAKYFDGIMNYHDFGYASPTKAQIESPRYEPNPIKYLWETQKDGFFEQGAGFHRPTFAAKIDLTLVQMEKIFKFIQQYDYKNYSLIGDQCSSYATQIASLAGLELECEITMQINPFICWNGDAIRFWEDPYYSQLTISTPDIVERSLIQAVREGKAERVPLN